MEGYIEPEVDQLTRQRVQLTEMTVDQYMERYNISERLLADLGGKKLVYTPETLLKRRGGSDFVKQFLNLPLRPEVTRVWENHRRSYHLEQKGQARGTGRETETLLSEKETWNGALMRLKEVFGGEDWF